MNIQEFTKSTYQVTGFYTRPRIVCNDGFSMSVQGGRGMYSSPRVNSQSFSSMEVGYPSVFEKELVNFAEDKGNPTGTVYGYVPCSIIQSVIEKHGGINISATLGQVKTIDNLCINSRDHCEVCGNNQANCFC